MENRPKVDLEQSWRDFFFHNFLYIFPECRNLKFG